MARIRYQPATKTKGFQPIQLTTAGISRMREETNRVVQGMEKNLAAEQRQRKENLQAMQENAAYTEQITKENRDIEVQNLKNEQLAITQTAQRDQQQAQYDADATETILSSLVDFSTTIAKTAAERTAKQLKNQTDAANAVPLAPLLIMDAGQYETAFSTFGKAAQIESTEAKIEGAESGESFAETYKRLASNAGLGTVGKRILDNRLYEAKHGIYTNRAFASDEKKYEINGKKFSGLEALNDSQMTAVVQAQVTRDLTRDMRETLGIAEPLYFTSGKTATEKKDALQLERSSARSIEQSQSMMLDNANVLLSSYNTNNATNAYSQIVDATRSYAKANASMVNAIKMASTKEEVQAIRNAVIIGQNGKATTWGERYSKSADEAERDRAQRIESDNNKARLARIRGVEERTLAAFNDGQIPAMIAENPFTAEEKLRDVFASVGKPLPTYLQQEIANVSTLFNADEIARYKRSGAEVPEKRINQATGTHQAALKALNKAAQLRKFGGDLGKKALSALDAIAKEEHKIGVDGATTPDAVLTGSALKRRWMDIWKEQGFGSQDPTTNAAEVAKTTAILNEERAKDKDNPQGRFYSKPDATNNSVVFPNLFPSTKDYQQMKTLVDKKFAAGRSIGEIASTPGLLATPAELTTLSQQSQISNNLRYPPLIMYAAAKMKGKIKPSEITNESIKANNLAFGENTPLIKPNIVSQAIDEASPKNATLMNSLHPSQRIQGFANHTGTANRPENMRSTFRNTPLQAFAPQVSSVTFDTGQPGIDVFFEDHNFPAVLPGIVKDIGYQVNANGSGYGHYLVIESIDPNTGEPVDVLYGHLPSKPTQSRGQSINLGEIIGKQGGTGSVQSYDGTIASIDFLAPAPPGSGSMTPYRNYDSLRRSIASQFQ